MRAHALALFVIALASHAAAQDARLAFPEGSTPARHLLGASSRIVDCAAHGAWEAPAGWDVRETPAHDVVVRAPDGGALLVRAARAHVRSTDTFRAAVLAVVTRLVAAAPSLGEVTEHARDRWHVDRSVEGTVSVAGRSVRVRASSDGERRLWVALVLDAVHEPTIAQAIGGWLMLTSHACACGYDCDRRPSGG